MTVGIVGLGLIGGSVGLSLRKPGRRLIGYDPSPKSAENALSRQCMDAEAAFDEVASADVVFIASPPSAVIENLEALAARRSEHTVATDCASVKSDIVAWAKAHKASWFVPGHPMAGHEKSGSAFSSSWMFRHAKWILCPLSSTDRHALASVEAIVREMGAVPVRMKPETHDRQVAILSHLPHVLAGVLVRMGSSLESTDIGAGSWKDLTRVGGVDPDLWTQILLGNREQVVQALDEARADMDRFREAVNANDAMALRSLLVDALEAKRVHEPPAKPMATSRPLSRSKRRP
jgi:prephenate dehydrogenase